MKTILVTGANGYLASYCRMLSHAPLLVAGKQRRCIVQQSIHHIRDDVRLAETNTAFRAGLPGSACSYRFLTQGSSAGKERFDCMSLVGVPEVPVQPLRSRTDLFHLVMGSAAGSIRAIILPRLVIRAVSGSLRQPGDCRSSLSRKPHQLILLFGCCLRQFQFIHGLFQDLAGLFHGFPAFQLVSSPLLPVSV